MFQFQRIWLYEIAIQILKTKTHCFSLTYWTSFTSHVWLHHEILISEKRSAILGGNWGCNTLYWVTLSKSLHLPMCFCLHGVQDSDMCVIKLTRVPRNITVNDKKKNKNSYNRFLSTSSLTGCGYLFNTHCKLNCLIMHDTNNP